MNVIVDYASLPREGESHSGDTVVVRREGALTLLAVVDALGHGSAASEVAGRAATHLRAALHGGALETMMALHEELRPTRGAAAMICFVKDGRLEGCGVGNVELLARGTHIPAILTSGIVGRAAPRFRRFQGPFPPGSRVVIFTDGISSRLALDDVAELTPLAACQTILRNHRRSYDDATVLVADAGQEDT